MKSLFKFPPKNLFRLPKNRLCVSFDGLGLVPVATGDDDIPIFETAEPCHIGDDAIILVEGKRRLVRLLRSKGQFVSRLYLVDMGPARTKKGTNQC